MNKLMILSNRILFYVFILIALAACGGGAHHPQNASVQSSRVATSSNSQSSVWSGTSSSSEQSLSWSSVSNSTINSSSQLSTSSTSQGTASSAEPIFINLISNRVELVVPNGMVAQKVGESNLFKVNEAADVRLASVSGCGAVLNTNVIRVDAQAESCELIVSFVKKGSFADSLSVHDLGIIHCLDELEQNTKEVLTADTITQLRCENAFNLVRSINDLTHFKHLQSLSLAGNRLQGHLNFSPWPELTSLNLSNNYIASLDLSNNSALTALNISGLHLTQLDFSPLLNLRSLHMESNNFSSVDLSKNTQLRYLNVSDNRLASIDITMLGLLTNLDVSRNQLISLDTLKNTKLLNLVMGWNNFSSVEIGHLQLLESLNVAGLHLTTIDVSKNTQLGELQLMENNLTHLDLTSLSKLQILYAYGNQLSTIDLHANTKLETLLLHSNKLISLDVTPLTELKTVWVNYNQLVSLDVSANTQLQWLFAPDNKMTSIKGIEFIRDKTAELDIYHNPWSEDTYNYLLHLYRDQGYDFLSF